MTNFLSFNFFKTKSFKAISLVLTLSLTSSLMVTTNHQSSTNSVNESNKLSGFHITVKENNKNLISEANNWNSINNKYEDFIRLNKEKEVITEQFDDWSDIINKVNVNPNEDNFSKDVNTKFTKQIKNKTNNILPDNDINNFTKDIIGRSVAKQSFNGISIFGYVYVGYHDDSLPAQINNGIFARVNPKADFNSYFSIPYMIKPGAVFLNIHKIVQDRLAILPLNNDNPNDTNQPMLAILAKNSKDEQLLINNKNDGFFNNDEISYAILNHNPKDGLTATTFKIAVKDSSYSKTINLINNSSNIKFSTVGNKNVKENSVITQYLVQNNSQNNKNTLIVMNKAIEEAKVSITNSQQKWLKWRVDPQTLQKAKDDFGTPIKDGDSLTLNQVINFQVYCIGLDTSDLQRQTASEQYITVYKSNTKIPTFPNCTDFFEEVNNKSNTLYAGFQQYLTSSTNNGIKVKDLKNNAGEFLSWFIQYQGAITKKKYVNYLQSNNSDYPWYVNIPLTTKTIVNNWNIIIICDFIISFLIIIPIVVVIIRKKKYLK